MYRRLEGCGGDDIEIGDKRPRSASEISGNPAASSRHRIDPVNLPIEDDESDLLSLESYLSNVHHQPA